MASVCFINAEIKDDPPQTDGSWTAAGCQLPVWVNKCHFMALLHPKYYCSNSVLWVPAGSLCSFCSSSGNTYLCVSELIAQRGRFFMDFKGLFTSRVTAQREISQRQACISQEKLKNQDKRIHSDVHNQNKNTF